MSFKYTTPVFQSKVINPDTGAFVKNVDSKYLTDANGNYVIDPTSPTGEPYIVPADMDFNQMVQRAAGLYANPITTADILMKFKTDGELDLQRTGIDSQKYGGFVSDYTSAASLYFGAVSGALAVPANIAEIGGGILNFYNSLSYDSVITTGDYFNNPKNVENMRAGLEYYQKNISANPVVDALVDVFDKIVDLVHDNLIAPTTNPVVRIENIANALTSVEKSAYEAMGFIVYDPASTNTASYKNTTVTTLTTTANNILIKYDTYSPTGTKTSSTVSAYSNTGDLIGRTTSQALPTDFITVPSTSSSASTLNALQQTQSKNETLAQDAFAVAKFVGLDKNSATTSDWITTLNSATTTGNTSPNIPYTPIIYYNDPTYFNNKTTRSVA